MTTLTRRAPAAIPSAVLALIGAGAVAGSIEIGVIEEGRIAAGFMPAVAGAALLALALVDLVQQLLRTRTTPGVAEALRERLVDERPPTTDQLEPVSDVDIHGRDQRTRNRQLAMVIVGLVVAMALVPLLGLLVSLAALMAYASIAVERRKVLPSLLITVVVVAVLWLVFGQVLGIPLPTGLLGGLLP